MKWPAVFVPLTLFFSGNLLCAQQEEDQTIAPVTFSIPDQTFSTSLRVELHCETGDTAIQYSIDGHPLTLFNSKSYTEPLVISETTWIRARAVTKDGRQSGLSSAHYIRLAEDVQEFESPLPILLLENFGQGTIPTKTWNQTGAGVKQVARQRAQWFLFEPNEQGRSLLAGEPTESSRLGVRVRGAFSSSFPRKPFSVEAWDEEDQPTNIKPLGMPAESDWILYAPNAQQDRTLLYNTWLYELSRSLGGNAVRFRFTEAFVHTHGGPLSMDDHAGVYVIMEKVKRDANRLDFPKLSEDGTEGGWLLSINRMDPIPVDGFPTPNGAESPQFFHTAGPNRILQTPANQAGRGDDIPRQSNAFINFESPNGYTINTAQRSAIESWFEKFEDVLYGDDFRDPEKGYTQYLDADNFVDYFILHDITRNTDGLLISMWVYKEGADAKLKMGPVWDYDLAYRDSPTSNLGLNRDRLWYGRLWQDPDFEQRYIDRWQSLRSGPMSDAAIHALIEKQSTEITEAVAKAHGISDWASRLDTWTNWIADRAQAIDKKFEKRPVLSHPGGPVDRGTNVSPRAGTIFAPRDIYYTTDGTDPRSPGGAIAPQAILASNAAVLIEQTSQLRARVLIEDTWSGLIEAWYFVEEAPADADNLQISKIHYHPSDPTPQEVAAGFSNDDDFEFIELTNTSDESVHLGGVHFADGIDFTFDHTAAIQRLPPGARVLLASKRAAFEQRYGKGLPLAGEYAGKLRNSGERLALFGHDDALIITDLEYNDRGSWPRSADGEGPSLVRLKGLVQATTEGAFQWRASRLDDGAPGIDDTQALDSDPLADADHDGIPALIEHALGKQTSAPALTRTLTIGEPHAEGLIRFPLNLFAGDITVVLESSLDLHRWTPVTGLQQVDRVYSGAGGITEETFKLPEPISTWKYLRLRVDLLK